MSAPRIKDYKRTWCVGDEVWTIKFVRKVPGEQCDENLFGLSDPSEQCNYIRLKQNKFKILCTFIHEMFHSIEAEYDFKIPHDLIWKLEIPIARFIIDNFLHDKRER